ncbi:uncharacterized protein [Elaeis guineensis]|uniref:uncharacterized protein isoform X1 n=1 Tax=Elaeis guineensis var. tenera TaxID=51953 RepID=UPI003C6D3761
MEEGLRDPEPQEEEQPWEERTLSLLQDSKIDQELSGEKEGKKWGKKHKVKWMKRPMTMPQAILEFLDEDLRENAIRYLSNYLFEKREEDPDNYYRAGFLVFNSCATMSVLLQEITGFYVKMVNETLNVRSIKRLANVLTLFQSVAANGETMQKFVDSCVPNFLVPLILFESKIEVFDNIRAIALSVIGILCQGREPSIIQWAIESDMVEVCRTIVETGSELTKVIAMHILEAILQDGFGISYVCNPICDHLLKGLIETWDKQISLLAIDQDLSPRLLFHIIRCYIILCKHDRGYVIVMNSLPDALTNGSFHEVMEEFPVIRNLMHQLLLNIGKIVEHPISSDPVQVHTVKEKMLESGLCIYDSVPTNAMVLKLIAHDQVTFLPSSLQCY